ncbi:exopolysaccharide biosynthesis polyprenyl glycosylphosphotransferase [Actinoplanes sp. NPDC020271]|uniref:exopolysaccharide biosynthesis polyprenyl glycosylphosphotransferase n=1 Tax=Actinoplanes sp. NPDC020271 TaxID=3363896 RepID=UPI0037AFF641
MSRSDITARLSTTRTPVTAPKAPGLVPVRKVRSGIGEIAILFILDVLAAVVVTVATRAAWPIVLLPLALAAAGLYRARLHFSALDDLPRVILAIAVAAAALHWLTPFPGPSRTVLGVLLAAVLLARTTGYSLLRAHRRSSPGRAAIIVGSGDLAVRVATALREDRSCGLTPVGFVGPRALAQRDLPVLAPVTDLERAVTRYRPLHLIVAYPAMPDSELVTRLRHCRRLGVTVHVVPRLHELAVGSRGADLVRGIPLTRLRPEPVQQRRWRLKRLVDVVGAATALVLLSPLLLLCAVAVKVESGRHAVIFRQERVTRDGAPFTIRKFRSLTPVDEAESCRRWNIDTDARVGRVGRMLRNSSLDELPQLVNVLTGSMSLVGPRPERPHFADLFGRVYNGYPDRHRVPAGITGWAQIHGLRGDTSIEDRVRFDNYYIEHWSLGLDLKIMLRTLGSMLHKPRG